MLLATALGFERVTLVLTNLPRFHIMLPSECTRVQSHSTSAHERTLMSRRTVTIADIARVAGVSHPTVSRALRGNPLISSDVRAQIQQLALEMGYIPNAVAQSLQMQRTNTIGLVVTSIADPFNGDVVKGVEQVARTANISVFLSAAHNDPDQELAVIETFHRRRVDGVLVASSRIGSSHAAQLARINVPTVLINSQADTPHALLHSVAVDDHAGARLAVDHLLRLGHRAIGYLGSESRPRSNARRLEAYRDALVAAGVQPRPDWVVIAAANEARQEDDVAAGQTLLPRLLQAGATAVFCYNDSIAIGALIACRAHGVSVPAQLSVIGFDDIAAARYMLPPLTTIHQPKHEMGDLAMRMLLDLLDERPVYDHVLAPTLVERGSTGAALSRKPEAGGGRQETGSRRRKAGNRKQ
jgi:DNA-binding LacI/PurR family transcriptional regulator